MSLRWLHLVFILVVLVLTDMFGAWALFEFAHSHDRTLLVAGIGSFALGFAVVGYSLWFVRKLDRTHTE